MYQTMTAIIEMTALGYYCDEAGNVYTPLGVKLVPQIKTTGYYSIRYRLTGTRKLLTIPVHRFNAYQKYGEIVFHCGVVVRHLNSNKLDNSWENLDIGDERDNFYDASKEVIARRAELGARKVRMFSPEEILDIRLLREEGYTLQYIANLFGTTKSNVWYITKQVTYKTGDVAESGRRGSLKSF